MLHPWTDQFGQSSLTDEHQEELERCRTACWAVPTVYFDTKGANIFVKDFVMKPVATDYSMGFINMNRWVNIWAHNNNAQYTYEEINDILRYYLMPYDSVFKLYETHECITCEYFKDKEKFVEATRRRG